MSKEGAENIIAAVAKAMNKKKFNLKSFNDRLMIQKGCFLLNLMEVGPKYKFSMYLKGPYSRELAEDYFMLGKNISYETDVPEKDINELSEIMGRGPKFVVAYTTIILMAGYRKDMKEDELADFVANLEPHIEREIVKEASEYRKIAASVT